MEKGTRLTFGTLPTWNQKYRIMGISEHVKDYVLLHVFLKQLTYFPSYLLTRSTSHRQPLV